MRKVYLSSGDLSLSYATSPPPDPFPQAPPLPRGDILTAAGRADARRRGRSCNYTAIGEEGEEGKDGKDGEEGDGDDDADCGKQFRCAQTATSGEECDKEEEEEGEIDEFAQLRAR